MSGVPRCYLNMSINKILATECNIKDYWAENSSQD